MMENLILKAVTEEEKNEEEEEVSLWGGNNDNYKAYVMAQFAGDCHLAWK